MVINIDKNKCAYVEKLWYDYNSLLELTRFLCESKVADEERKYYLDELKETYAKLEIAKDEVSKEYIKDGFSTYKFDFPNSQLIVS